MALTNDLIAEFIEVTTDKVEKKNESTHFGTIVEYEGSKYVRLDGSDLLTPILQTTYAENEERVTVLIKDHKAIVTGNLSSPAARTETVQQIGNRITEAEILIADKVSTKEFDAQNGRIDNLVSDNVLIREELVANEALIDELEADNVKINESLTAQQATIEELETQKLSANDADLKYATIVDLDAANADIHNLESDYGAFVELTTKNFEASDAAIGKLETEKLSTTAAEVMYANIDFSNIGKAAMEYLYTASGLIDNVVIGDATISGNLVGVTIKGDLIEGGTVIAEKLVIKGTNGLYYKLNTDGVTTETEQTEYNSLNGSIITAKSISATKISVEDLVAFGATIGGFNITEDSIYSGVKSSVNNTTRGIYLDNDGQVAFGDSSNFFRYYKDQNGNYKLEISAASIKFGINNKNLETVMSETITKSVEEFYASKSPTSLSGGSWSTNQPTWTEGVYIWRRTAVTYGDGSSEYTPSANGVCITGNTGAKGDSGKDGEDSVLLYIDSSNGTVFKNSSVSTVLSVVIYYGSKRITNIDMLRAEFGESSYVQWKWKLPEDDDYVPVALDDYRISGSGFEFTISADDVVSRATFICDLII